jgi:hypothetical protein
MITTLEFTGDPRLTMIEVLRVARSGLILGVLLFENLAWGSGIGAAVGLLVGAAIDAQGRRETDSAD